MWKRLMRAGFDQANRLAKPCVFNGKEAPSSYSTKDGHRVFRCNRATGDKTTTYSAKPGYVFNVAQSESMRRHLMRATSTGVILATAVALAFMTRPPAARADSGAMAKGKVRCLGGNSCAGQSACKTATSPGPGKNSCKGQGFTMTNSVKECKDAGGRPEKKKM